MHEAILEALVLVRELVQVLDRLDALYHDGHNEDAPRMGARRSPWE